MIAFPTGVRVWLATGHTDMRKGFSTLALLVQERLKTDPHGGHLFVFRGRRGDLIKLTPEARSPAQHWKAWRSGVLVVSGLDANLHRALQPGHQDVEPFVWTAARQQAAVRCG